MQQQHSNHGYEYHFGANSGQSNPRYVHSASYQHNQLPNLNPMNNINDLIS